MNGIMPGPLWLAIASATNRASSENGTLIRSSKSGNVTTKIVDSQKDVADSERNGRGNGEHRREQ
jgi:hypothetical protein